MPIKREIRVSGESLVVSIPKQVAKLNGVKVGDFVEFDKNMRMKYIKREE